MKTVDDDAMFRKLQEIKSVASLGMMSDYRSWHSRSTIPTHHIVPGAHHTFLVDMSLEAGEIFHNLDSIQEEEASSKTRPPVTREERCDRNLLSYCTNPQTRIRM